MQDIIIIGAGGHGKVILDIIENGNKFHRGGVIIDFLDDALPVGTDICGYKVIGKIESCLKYPHAEYIIAIGDNKTRKEIAEKYNLKYISIVHPSAVIGKEVKIKSGSVIMANAVINSTSIIGSHSIINTGAIIEHDNVIDDYVHISPSATLGGNVKIGQCSWIGIGSVVSNNLSICDNCIIGAGAVVVKDITEAGMYAGVPVKKVHK